MDPRRRSSSVPSPHGAASVVASIRRLRPRPPGRRFRSPTTTATSSEGATPGNTGTYGNFAGGGRRPLGARDVRARARRRARLPRRRGSRKHDRHLLRHLPSRCGEHASGDLSEVPSPTRKGGVPSGHDRLVFEALRPRRRVVGRRSTHAALEAYIVAERQGRRIRYGKH
jgi:hypothetical protein